MRLFKTLLLVVVMCMVLPTHTLAQNTSTQGKEFWLTFMHNGFKEHPLGGWITNQVLISAKRDCSGTISNPKTGWSVQFNVNANSITTVDIPIEQGYHDRSNYSTVSKKAIHIVSTDTISAYCTNIAYVSFDASFVLPTESLGDDYIIQSFNQSRMFLEDVVNVNQTSAFAIVATEDNQGDTLYIAVDDEWRVKLLVGHEQVTDNVLHHHAVGRQTLKLPGCLAHL